MDTYPYALDESRIRNYHDGDRIAGFEVDVRTDYYRGVPLSMVDNFTVTVDGIDYDPAQTAFKVGGRTFGEHERLEDGVTRWPWGDWASLVVESEGGLAPGAHDVTVSIGLRVSYAVNHMSTAVSSKTLTVSE